MQLSVTRYTVLVQIRMADSHAQAGFGLRERGCRNLGATVQLPTVTMC